MILLEDKTFASQPANVRRERCILVIILLTHTTTIADQDEVFCSKMGGNNKRHGTTDPKNVPD